MRWFRPVVGVLEKCVTLFGVPVRRTLYVEGRKRRKKKSLNEEIHKNFNLIIYQIAVFAQM